MVSVLGVAVDAAEAEVLVRARLAGRPPEHGDPGPVRTPDQGEQRCDHGDDDAGQHAQEGHGGEAHDRELRVALVDPPQLPEPAHVDEADDGGDDDRGERRLRQAVEQRGQEQHRGDEQRRHDQPREARADACAGTDGAAREARVDGKALQQAGPDVRRAERDELLVRVDLVASLRCERARGADRLCQRDERQRQRAAAESADLAEADVRDGGSRKPGRHVRDHRDTVGREVEGTAERDRDGRDDERPGNPRCHPAKHEERNQRPDARRAGCASRSRPASRSARQSVSGTLPLSTGSPSSFGSCPTMITTPIPLMKPSTHRAGEELGHEPEAQGPRDDEHDSREDGERGEERRVLLLRELRDDGDEHRGRRDRDRRARADVQFAAGAEDGVHHACGESREEPRLGRRAGERSVGDGLRHEHRPDGEAGEQVAGEERPLVPGEPPGDRDVAREGSGIEWDCTLVSAEI